MTIFPVGKHNDSHYYSRHPRYSERIEEYKATTKTSKTTKTFRSWLKARMDEDTHIGDLARDGFADSEWTGLTAKSLYKVMRFSACDGAMEALWDAIRDYIAEVELSDQQITNLEALETSYKY